METSFSLKRKFNRDFKLNVHIFREKYFEYFVDLYGYNDLYKWFLNYIKKFKDKAEFYDYCSNIQNTIINYIKNDNNYKWFNECNMDKYKIDLDFNGFSKGGCFANDYYIQTLKEFYKSDNVGKTWLSIDLAKANIQALQYVNVITEDDYEDFIHNFTDDEYFIKSKYVREIIFGQTNPSRITTVVKYLTIELYKQLREAFLNYDCDIYYHNSDEILMDVTNITDQDRNNIYDSVSKLTTLKLNKNLFIFKSLETNLKTFYYKQHILPNYGEVEFKGVPSYLYPMVYKLYHNLEIYPEFDCMFEHESGLLCKFEEFLTLKSNLCV